MPQKMRVSNHSEYNKFLEKRGNIFHYINEAIEICIKLGQKCRVATIFTAIKW
uniref:hypothetical protein n=1 Tax=Wolbachia endosymbiont of Oedothorax gibbosus TaxID=931100 RepID=UPI0020245343|nr:hypothetical protein [Wolbachia endosymbiont of Oedothorax gibbosus]